MSSAVNDLSAGSAFSVVCHTSMALMRGADHMLASTLQEHSICRLLTTIHAKSILQYRLRLRVARFMC
jgi:hypothetical protein